MLYGTPVVLVLVLVAGKTLSNAKTKKRDKNKKKNVTKAKKAKNYGRVPQQIISSSAITGREGLRGGRICRACLPKWARSKYVYPIVRTLLPDTMYEMKGLRDGTS